MHRKAIAPAIGALGVVLGVFSLGVARGDPAYSLAGSSPAAAVALLAAAGSLMISGMGFWIRRPESRIGPLLAAAGFAWLLPELDNPGVDSAVAFTAGLALSGSSAALVAHAVLGYPRGRLGSAVERTTVALAYTGGVVLVGALPALLSDPRSDGCGQCPRNLLFVADGSSGADELERAGLALGLVSSLAIATLCARRMLAAGRSSRLVLATGGAYLVLVAAEDAAFLDRGFLSNGTLERRLWLAQACALVALAAAVAWGWLRARRARSAVARLVVDLARSPPPGGLRDALSGIVGDPDLVLAYPLEETGRLVDADGRPVALAGDREHTVLARDGRPVAVVGHARGVLDDEQLVEEVTAAARLALENERLQAGVRARLDELRASRARIVEAGDAERRRLEQDLHDGAQQRLVGLSLSLRLLRNRLPAAGLERAEAELRLAIMELRELAHGIFPAVLADRGLAAAVEALAEEARVPLRIDRLAEGRFGAPVETAAYTIVAEVARTATSRVDVRTEESGGVLEVELETPGADGIDAVELADRVGALGGRLAIRRAADGRTTIRAELPCAS